MRVLEGKKEAQEFRQNVENESKEIDSPLQSPEEFADWVSLKEYLAEIVLGGISKITGVLSWSPSLVEPKKFPEG